MGLFSGITKTFKKVANEGAHVAQYANPQIYIAKLATQKVVPKRYAKVADMGANVYGDSPVTGVGKLGQTGNISKAVATKSVVDSASQTKAGKYTEAAIAVYAGANGVYQNVKAGQQAETQLEMKSPGITQPVSYTPAATDPGASDSSGITLGEGLAVAGVVGLVVFAGRSFFK